LRGCGCSVQGPLRGAAGGRRGHGGRGQIVEARWLAGHVKVVMSAEAGRVALHLLCDNKPKCLMSTWGQDHDDKSYSPVGSCWVCALSGQPNLLCMGIQAADHVCCRRVEDDAQRQLQPSEGQKPTKPPYDAPTISCFLLSNAHQHLNKRLLYHAPRNKAEEGRRAPFHLKPPSAPP
jgi:hypothetical protein